MSNLVVYVLATVVAVSAVKIPPQLKLKKCNYSSPKFEECLRAAVEGAVPKLKNGSTELGIPVIEPVEITEISLGTDKNAPISLDLKLKHLNLWGISTALKLNQLKWDRKNRVLGINSTNDKIVMKGEYESKGKILAIPLSGKGPIKIELTDISAEMRIEFKNVVRKGVQYLEVSKFSYNVAKVGNVKMRLEGLIKGNDAMNDNLNQVLNENWQELDRQMRPAFGKALELYFSGISQRFFRRVPVNDIFDGYKQS